MSSSSWFNGILVSIGVPLVCAGLAFLTAGRLVAQPLSVEQRRRQEEALIEDIQREAVAVDASSGGQSRSSSGTSSKSSKRTKSKGKPKSKPKDKPKSQKDAPSSSELGGKSGLYGGSAVDGDSDSDNGNDGDRREPTMSDSPSSDILLLAALSGAGAKPSNIVKKTPSAVLLSPPPAVSRQAGGPSLTTESPVTMAIGLQFDERSAFPGQQSKLESDVDAREGGWSRVPTRAEEIATGLRQRIESLTRDLRAAEDDRARVAADLELRDRRLKEAEHDWRERCRSLAQQVSNLDNELTSARADTGYLSQQLQQVGEEGERRTTALQSAIIDKENLMKRNNDLEGQLAAAEKRASQAEAKSSELSASLSDTQSQVSVLRDSLSQAEDSLAELQRQRREERERETAAVTDLQARLARLQQELQTAREDLAAAESDLQHHKAVNGRLLADRETAEQQATALAWLEEAYTLNCKYVSEAVLEDSHRQYQEKAALVSDLVAVRKQLKGLLRT